MTIIQIDLPEATAKAALEQRLVEAIRRQTGRRFLGAAKRIHDAGIEEMSMDEINAEVTAARAERGAWENKQAQDGHALPIDILFKELQSSRTSPIKR